jgi:hypothetical protein
LRGKDPPAPACSAEFRCKGGVLDRYPYAPITARLNRSKGQTQQYSMLHTLQLLPVRWTTPPPGTVSAPYSMPIASLATPHACLALSCSALTATTLLYVPMWDSSTVPGQCAFCRASIVGPFLEPRPASPPSKAVGQKCPKRPASPLPKAEERGERISGKLRQGGRRSDGRKAQDASAGRA